MDYLPNEIIQSIFDYSDIMSLIMLSMTCKRVKEVYDSNGYITSKDIPIKVHDGNKGNNTNIVNIKMCNTLSDIVETVKSHKSIDRNRVRSVRLCKNVNIKEKCIVYKDGNYTISYFYYGNRGNLVRNDTSINGDIPIGNMDLWNDIICIRVYYGKR